MDFVNLLNLSNYKPEKISYSDAWVGHLPFAYWLISELKPSIFVELGTFSGNSYFGFCKSVKDHKLSTKCYAIDTWKGDEHGGFYEENIFLEVEKYNKEYFSSFSRLMRISFDDAIDYFSDNSIDLLHIDGLHTYEAVKHDFETWLPKLSPNAVVLFHDTNVRERDFGVWKLWNELCANYSHNLEFVHSNGLGVLGISEDYNSSELDFLNQNFAYKKIFKDYFTGLGQKSLDQFVAQETNRKLNEQKNKNENLEQQIESNFDEFTKLSQINNALQKQVEEGNLQITTLQKQVEEGNLQINLLTSEYDEQSIKQITLKTDISTLQGNIDELKKYLNKRELILKDLNSKLLEIYSSTAWKMIKWMWKFRLWIVPKNSIQEKFIYYLRKNKNSIKPETNADSNYEKLIKKPLNQQNWTVMATPHTIFIAELIASRLRYHKCVVDIKLSSPDEFSHDYYVVICPQMFPILPPGEKRIVFQMEQSISSRWFTEEYIKILEESLIVLDYNLTNIEFLKPKNIQYPHVYYLPIGGLQNVKFNSQRIEKKFEILFFGDSLSSQRRQEMLKALNEKYNVEIITDLFGEELNKKIIQSKVVLNLHYYENALLETPRIYQCLSLGVPVISESSRDQTNYPDLAKSVIFFKEGSIEDMMKAVQRFFESPTTNEDLVESVNKSADNFSYMFDRFLIGMDFIPPSKIKNLVLSGISPKMVLSLPETFERRKNLINTLPNEFNFYSGFRLQPGWRGCALSYKALSIAAIKTNLAQLTVMEDDVLLDEDFPTKLLVIYEYLKNIEGEWDIFSGFIANLHPEVQILKTESYKGINFITINKMTSTVFNIYSKKALEIISLWDETNFDVVKNTIDRYIENQNNLRIVTTIPYFVGHREDENSTIWGFNNSQYFNMVEASERDLLNKVKEYQQQHN